MYSIRLAYRRQIPVLTYLLKSSEQDLVLTVPLPNAQQQVWTSWVLCFLFVCGFTSYSRIFHSYGGATITGEGLHILTYTRHSWPLSSVGSLACHTSCDTGHPFIMDITEDPWHSHLLPSVWLWNCHYLISRLKRRSWDSNTQPSACLANALTDYATAAVMSALDETIKICTRPTVSVAYYHSILTYSMATIAEHRSAFETTHGYWWHLDMTEILLKGSKQQIKYNSKSKLQWCSSVLTTYFIRFRHSIFKNVFMSF